MNEQETRTNLILPLIQAAGWGSVEGSKIREEFPISQGRLIGSGRRSAPSKADFVLQYKNRNLAIIEAKSDEKEYNEGVTQAKDYAQRLEVRFTYSTNGKKYYGIDMQKGTEGDVDTIPSPDDLWQMTFGEEDLPQETTAWRDKLQTVPFEDRGGSWQPRYYQENAIRNVLDSIAKGKKRLLLTLATGTGKTAIAFQIAWKLFHSRWNLNKDGQRLPRILFLADRNILADQAFNAFSAFEEDALVRIRPSDIKKKGSVPKNGSIFFTIFQTFMSGDDGKHYFGEYPEDYFDFIIIDECHRGGASDESNWRGIMEHFKPAVQLGLTATPKRKQNMNTYKYFGKPTYVYSLKEGINDGFLTPFKVKQVKTTIDDYVYTSDDVVEEGEIDREKKYTEEEMNRVIKIKAREEYRVKLFMDMMDQSQKTIVFCATQLHALAVRDIINQYADSNNPDYCHRVTADEGKLGEEHLRRFQDNERTIPTVLTTSQKLSTGVDAPELRNIVLMRPINSMIEFKQILGRGTRLYDKKDFFTLYDFVDASHHFLDDGWDGESLECEDCGETICKCGGRILSICDECNTRPCECEKDRNDLCKLCGKYPCECEPKAKASIIKVKLSDGKVRELDSMVQTSFWSPDGKPMSSTEFLENIFGVFPDFFKDEDELRRIWSLPETRKKLLQSLEEKGFPREQLKDLQRTIQAEDSDLYDVLAYVAFTSNPIARSKRAETAAEFFDLYESKERAFIDFVLDKYVKDGEDELDDEKLSTLLELKYSSVQDAIRELGETGKIRDTFISFQKYLYKG
jgi:type I restriction enzyme, R subunit